MHPALNRLVPFLALLLIALGLFPSVSAASNPPIFLTGTSGPYPDYAQFSSVPVGKTLVVPIAVSGTGPMTYSVTSNNIYVKPIIKTGYPVMSIHVTYSGTNGPVTPLYTFTGGNDGGSPYAGLITGTDGNFYGTAETDGTGGDGTVYRITASGSLTTLHSFTGGSDGANPYAPLVQGAGGDLFGTTQTGGGGHFGTIYQITASGSLTTLYTFTGGVDGGSPYAGLAEGANGIFYGTTKDDGKGFGTVYRITASGSFATLHSFTGGAAGAFPQAGLVTGTDGNFYGTTIAGGASSAGTVYRITAAGSLATLHSFSGGKDGASPYAGLIQASDGNFYGTTETDGGGGSGTVYKITASGSLTTLHAFTGVADGGNPYAPLVEASDGNLYGTTETDGANTFGTVYQITAAGSLTTLYSFTGGNDGGNPYAPLVQGTGGNLYGTTKTSGAENHGTVFQIPLPNAGAFAGTMTFALLRDMAPITTGYITGFAQAGYYNGLDFFRITNLDTSSTNGFIAQAGDLTNTGTGNPGFAFDNELNPSLIFNGQGQLAMANAGIDQSTFRGTNGSQFFITQGPIRALDFGYTIFGQLLTGFDTMQQVMSVPLVSGTSPSVPVSPVVMDSVTVSENSTDAILLVNAAGFDPRVATITVNATNPSGSKAILISGTVASTGLPITVSTVDDSVNDPPIIEPDPNVTAALHQSISFPIKAQDLEFDSLLTNAQFLSFSLANLTVNGNSAIVTPRASAPIGSVSVGLSVYQPYVSVERSNIADLTALTVAFGSGKLTSLPALFTGSSNGALASSTAGFTGSSTTFGSFLSSNPLDVPAEFTASINWGDGNLTTGTGSVSVIHASGIPTEYNVSSPSGHRYAHPGIYPVNVTVTDSNGAILQVQNTAVVSSDPIHPFGRTFTAAAGLADCRVATFVDQSPNVVPADYLAVINWGDGAVNHGTIRGSNGNFAIYGSHQYAAGATYPVDVTVLSRINHNFGYAWSIAKLSGIPTHQPPFQQSHITGQIGNPGFNGDFLDEEVTLINSGNIASGPISLRFYLSPTPSIGSSAIPLAIGKAGTYNTIPIPAGSAIEGSVSDITLPSNAVTRGKYIIMQVITSDPIGSHMDYPRAFADPDPLIE